MFSTTFDRGVFRGSMAISFALTLIASSAVLVARLTRGSMSLAWLASAVVTLAAIACTMSIRVFGVRPERRMSLLTAHGVGMVTALGAVHVVVVLRGASFDAALVERPNQMVNDLVLVGAILGLCWSLDAVSRLVRTGLPILSLAMVAAYSATASRWHVDGFSGNGVQRYVVQQCLGTAGALLVFDLLRPTGRRAQ